MARMVAAGRTKHSAAKELAALSPGITDRLRRKFRRNPRALLARIRLPRSTSIPFPQIAADMLAAVNTQAVWRRAVEDTPHTRVMRAAMEGNPHLQAMCEMENSHLQVMRNLMSTAAPVSEFCPAVPGFLSNLSPNFDQLVAAIARFKSNTS
jgi:hypothetical protein